MPSGCVSITPRTSKLKWQDDPDGFDYIVEEPEVIQKVALNLSLSATIDNERIINVLGTDTSIWTVTIPKPDNDF